MKSTLDLKIFLGQGPYVPRRKKSELPSGTRVFPSARVPPSSFQEQLKLLGDILADPQDVSTDQELSDQTGLSLPQVRELKSNANFMEPVKNRFLSSLGAVKLDLIRNLVRLSSIDPRAAKLLGETLGLYGAGGRGAAAPDPSGKETSLSHLSDIEVDALISRLLQETSPSDLAYVNGVMVPGNTFQILPDDDIASRPV